MSSPRVCLRAFLPSIIYSLPASPGEQKLERIHALGINLAPVAHARPRAFLSDASGYPKIFVILS